MASHKQYTERLQMVIQQLHGCGATWLESVPVHEMFRGKTLWRGVVEVFDVSGHPTAKRAYGWSHRSGRGDNDERFVTVIGLPPVDSPEAAVKIAAAAEIKAARRKAGNQKPETSIAKRGRL